MDELKLLIEMVSHLPTLAVWVLVGYLMYKVAVIGSIYGVIRLLIYKVYDWKTQPVTFKLGSKVIDVETAGALQARLLRLNKVGSYIHMSDVTTLRRALDTYLAGKP